MRFCQVAFVTIRSQWRSVRSSLEEDRLCWQWKTKRSVLISTATRTKSCYFQGTPKPSLFRATRIRVWRITQVVDHISFQFEYLMAKDTFEWITLDTNQSILMSLLLQSIGSEILYEHNNMTIEQQIMKEKQQKGNYVEKSDKLPVSVSMLYWIVLNANVLQRDPKKPIIVLKNAVEETDPLGVMEHYHNYNRMLTTISVSGREGICDREKKTCLCFFSGRHSTKKSSVHRHYQWWSVRWTHIFHANFSPVSAQKCIKSQSLKPVLKSFCHFICLFLCIFIFCTIFCVTWKFED